MLNVPCPALRICANSGEIISTDINSADIKKPLAGVAMANRFRILFVRFRRGRQLKTNAEIIVLLRGGFQVELRDCDLAMMPGRQVVKHVSHNSVILDVYLVAIPEVDSNSD